MVVAHWRALGERIVARRARAVDALAHVWVAVEAGVALPAVGARAALADEASRAAALPRRRARHHLDWLERPHLAVVKVVEVASGRVAADDDIVAHADKSVGARRPRAAADRRRRAPHHLAKVAGDARAVDRDGLRGRLRPRVVVDLAVPSLDGVGVIDVDGGCGVSHPVEVLARAAPIGRWRVAERTPEAWSGARVGVGLRLCGEALIGPQLGGGLVQRALCVVRLHVVERRRAAGQSCCWSRRAAARSDGWRRRRRGAWRGDGRHGRWGADSTGDFARVADERGRTVAGELGARGEAGADAHARDARRLRAHAVVAGARADALDVRVVAGAEPVDRGEVGARASHAVDAVVGQACARARGENGWERRFVWICRWAFVVDECEFYAVPAASVHQLVIENCPRRADNGASVAKTGFLRAVGIGSAGPLAPLARR
eukprot:3208267-Prymnesium_polylepis.1